MVARSNSDAAKSARASTSSGRSHAIVVDDDPAVRSSISRELRGHYEIWEAASHDEAMALLSRTPHLVAIVSDLDLGSGHSGAQLLAHVAQHMPDVIRVLVSASVSVNEASCLIERNVCHRVFEKPWNSGVIAASLQGRAASTNGRS